MNTTVRFSTEALCLRVMDYGEADRIVTLFTKDFGKVRGIAKGAKRSRRRFANVLEPFCRFQALFTKKGKSALALIEEGRVITPYPEIRGDLDKTLTASCLIDLVDHFTPDWKAQPALYTLLQDFLALLERNVAAEKLLLLFSLRLLKQNGYEPVLDRCTACRTPLDASPVYTFHLRDGGLKCPRCAAASPSDLTLSLGTVKTLLLGASLSPDRLHCIAFSPQALREGRRCLEHFIRHILGHEPQSLRVMEEVRSLAP